MCLRRAGRDSIRRNFDAKTNTVEYNGSSSLERRGELGFLVDDPKETPEQKERISFASWKRSYGSLR